MTEKVKNLSGSTQEGITQKSYSVKIGQKRKKHGPQSQAKSCTLKILKI